MDDEEIIGLYMARSEQAIAETSARYGRYCRHIALNILYNDADAEECVSDTYLRTWNAIPPAHPNRLQTFLGKITRNLSLNRWERLTAEKRGGGQVTLALDELSECIPAASDGDIAADVAIREVLEAFLDTLPPKTRRMFVRRYWYLSPIRQIAEEYGLTENNVTVTLFRARAQLKNMLEREEINL